jgi:hypothetical protein
MYYNMRVKTIRRQLSDMLAKLEAGNDHLLKSPRERMRLLYRAVKEVGCQFVKNLVILAQVKGYHKSSYMYVGQ